MDLTDVTVPYEILIRFGLDGALKGAHQQRRRIVRLGEEIVNEQELPAEPIDLALMGDVLGEAAGRALADTAALVAERDRLQAERDGLAATLAAVTNVRDQMAAELAATQTALGAALAEIQAVREEVGWGEAPPQEA